MAQTASNAFVAKPLATGGVLVAPVGTSLPTNESTNPNASFVAVGYITEDGVTRTEDRNTDTKPAWGGDTIATTAGAFTTQFKFAMAEYLNPVAQAAIYGDTNVSTTAATTSSGAKTTVKATSSAAPNKAWVLEMIAGAAKVRIVIPSANITDVGDVKYSDGDVAALDVTLTCYPDASGAYYYQYTNDGVKTS